MKYRTAAASRQAVRLRKVACEWAAHIHDEPKDDQDRASKARWERLAHAAYEYARYVGAISGIKAGGA